MSVIKEREIAFLKTTGEIVFVLEFSDPSPKIGDKELKAHVRRPIAGRNGITHIVDSFYLSELESLEEQRARFMAERQEVVSKYGPNQAEALSPIN